MRRLLPTSTSLLCFDASARHLSFTRAAEELNLTQSAVSRQVRNLEIFLKTDLFHRIKKRLSLTDDGRSYAATINDHLNSLEAETFKLISKDQTNRRLTLGTLPTFGSRWLIPKLSDFTNQFPEIHYDLITSLVPFDFDKQDIDVAIQHGKGDWPGVTSKKIVTEKVVAACSPDLIKSGSIPQPKDALDHTLLHLKTRSYAWPEWLSEYGINSNLPDFGPRFETFSMMIGAALSGLGVAIIPTMYIHEELREGRLITPFGRAIESQEGYYLTYKEEKLKSEKVFQFCQWLAQYHH